MKLTEDEFNNKYIKQLNEKQVQAVKAVDGPVLLLAVPGSGKTTVLVNRLGYMVFCKGINPDNILALTYNRAATEDMAKRFSKVFGDEYRDLIEFRTINGICQKIIMQYGNNVKKAPFSLCDDEKLLAKVLTEILSRKLSEFPTESDVKEAKTLITYAKNTLLTDAEIEKLGKDSDLPLLDIYKEYNLYLKTNQLMDYDDQMVYAYRMLRRSPELLQYYRDTYKYICVDEAQDTSKVQHIIIGMLAGENGNLFMVGDEDQSIYGFRAAYPEALLNFEKDHPNAKVLVMDTNYRSNAKIVAAADAFIQRNVDRHKKHMVATKDSGSDVEYISLNKREKQYDYLLNIARNCDHETAVLYRENESVLPLVDLLERNGIPYRIKNSDMTFFTHRVVTDVVNILRFAMDPNDTKLFMKIYFKCQTFLKKAQAEEMCSISQARECTVLNAVKDLDSANTMLIGKCRALQTNLSSMLNEEPSKALFRIENPMGYGEYLERNGLDDNKLYILKALAKNEKTIEDFLERLDYLQEMLKDRQQDYSCKLILSTIHSSKGLEYEQVYIIDVCDGVFPSQLIKKKSSTEEKKDYEEERRLFYVGMTRAKNELSLFNYGDRSSCFINEIIPEEFKKEDSKAIKNTYAVKKAKFG